MFIWLIIDYDNTVELVCLTLVRFCGRYILRLPRSFGKHFFPVFLPKTYILFTAGLTFVMFLSLSSVLYVLLRKRLASRLAFLSQKTFLSPS